MTGLELSLEESHALFECFPGFPQALFPVREGIAEPESQLGDQVICLGVVFGNETGRGQGSETLAEFFGRFPGTAQAWIYLRNEGDYASDSIRKSFRFLLKEAGAQQGIRRITVPTGPSEQALAAFLEAIGFARAGVLREALYLHGRYHDVTVFDLAFDAA